MSTVEAGNQFRDTIKSLVQLAGWRPDTERLVGGKKADLLFHRMQFGRRLTLAVEAKNYAAPLGQSELEKIVGGYVAGQQANEIDQLWIVARHELKGGKEYIDKFRWVQFFTQQSLLGVLMDFSSYLNNIIIDHETMGLEEYFITPQARFEAAPENHFSLMDYLERWQCGADRRPIAIVEGYGTGKTSIALHLSYKLALRCLDGANARIPIYVELGRLTSQQRIGGVLTSLFAHDHLIDNFSYKLFRRMNQMGCFLVILDGFDEMKHLMTPADFEFNFGQLNELVEGDARVILLGRPSAFSSGEEREYLLHGSRKFDGEVMQDTAKPNYIEIRLQPFTKPQVADFVERFLNYKARNVAAGAEPLSPETIQARLKEIKGNDYGDLLERPVQARMLAELATAQPKPLGQLTRFSLYKRFMDELIRREMKKEARQQFSGTKRRRFSQQLSWWMWSTNHTLGVQLQQLPPELFKPYSVSDSNIQAVRRDLVSGSFLDAKEGDLFIVPHRSMIEFNVADYIITEALDGRLDAEFLGQSWQLVTTDVLAFIFESGSKRTLTALFEALRSYQGFLPDQLVGQLAGKRDFIEIILSNSTAIWSPWHLQIIGRSLLACAFDARERPMKSLLELELHVASYLKSHSQEAIAVASGILALLPMAALDSLRFEVTRAVISIVIRHADVSRLTFSADDRDKIVVLSLNDPNGKVIDAVRRSLRAHNSDGTLCIVVNLAELFRLLGNTLYPRYAAITDASSIVSMEARVRSSTLLSSRLPKKITYPFNELRTEDTKENWEILRRFLTVNPTVMVLQLPEHGMR